ncbi:MAG TPA: high frequency lysogenization protein HflD [Alcanivoracaceae bacterium]|nr:high frequency lysogenization protein HflD [Alcanivoracaceae bacterium]
MSNYTATQQQGIALAALFQACSLVDRVAHDGQWDEEAVAPLINATLNLSPPSFESIYPDLQGLQHGMLLLENIFLRQGLQQANHRSTQYAMTVLYLTRRALKDTQLMDNLSQRLAALNGQLAHFESTTSSDMCHRLAGIYVDTIGTMPKRIKVAGKPEHLQNVLTAARIRALLLTAVRAAALWRQCGGKQWHLLFSRSRLINSLKDIQSNK